MNLPKPTRYWQYWGALVLLLICSVIMIGAADWSHSMKKRMGLGFANDVVNPVTALCLARNGATFREVLGMGQDGTAAGASLPDIEKDVESAVHVLLVDYFFMAFYLAVCLLLARYFWSSRIIRSSEKPVMLALVILPAAVVLADAVENTLALVALGPVRTEIENQARSLTPVTPLPEVVTASTFPMPAQAAPPSWKELQKRHVLLVSASDSKTSLIKTAGLEGADALTLNRMQQAEDYTSAKALLEQVYKVQEKDSVIGKVRAAAREPNPVMYYASKLKWIFSSLLVILLGALMIRPRGRVRRMPGLDWCASGLLMITGGILGIFGTFLYPVCLQSGMSFIIAAFVPLVIGGLRRFMICATGSLT